MVGPSRVFATSLLAPLPVCVGTSPAGTTISAIRELENHGVRAALIAALEAARDRSRELATGNG